MDLDALVNDFPALETGRLVLRRFVPADLADAMTFFGDPDVGRHTTSFALVSRHGVPGLLDHIERRGRWRCGGSYPRRGRVIGFCGLVEIAPDDRRAEIGYSLARAHWGRGYAPEAVRAVRGYAFATLGFNRIEAYCTAENAASIRVLEKVGMRREGVLRAHTTIDGRPRDRAVYGMLRRDWPTDDERVWSMFGE